MCILNISHPVITYCFKDITFIVVCKLSLSIFLVFKQIYALIDLSGLPCSLAAVSSFIVSVSAKGFLLIIQYAHGLK